MKTGRNDPCPCGSGKKYKKCCYLIESNTADELYGMPDDESDDFEMQELLYHAVFNMRKYILEKKPHIKEYHKARKLHSEIMNSMIAYQEDGKFHQHTVKSHVLQDKHENEVHLLQSNFDLETDVGARGYYDMLIYKAAPNVNCITEDFIEKHRYRKPEKIALLHSMLESKLGLFEITRIDENDGYAYLKEVFTGAEYKIIDVGLSGDTNHNNFYLYTRIIQYHDIHFGSGLNFIFTKTDDFIRNHIQHHKADYLPNREMIRFTQLYNRFSAFPGELKVFSNSIT